MRGSLCRCLPWMRCDISSADALVNDNTRISSGWRVLCKQPCDISDDGSGFACSRARKHEGVVTCAGDRADLLVAQFVLFDIADDVTRLVDAVGWQQRLRGELCRPLRLVLLRLTALRLTLRRGMRLQLRVA